MWVKKGILFRNDGLGSPKLGSHAANPLPVLVRNNLYRCYFSARDLDNRSSVGAVDIDFAKMRVIKQHDNVFFEHGSAGSFFSDGVSIGSCYCIGDMRYILFMGWQNDAGRHWFGQIGRLLVNQDFSLSLDSKDPLLPLDDEDPISLSYPWVIFYGNRYRMWYGSTIQWDAGNGEMLHVIKYAESIDGTNWDKQGQVIQSVLGQNQAFSRPSVYVDSNGKFHMWFSYRGGVGQNYRIGYCSSLDGYDWSSPRQDLDVSNAGWDKEMVEYPFVLNFKGRLLMLYNGDGYGRSGFGVAEASNHFS